MNYSAHYDRLIKRAIKRKLVNAYFENHHIIPRCLGGSDHKDNIVALTAEEHYLAHLLLVKIYPKNKNLIFTANMMCVSSEGQVRNNKRYKWLREKLSERLSDMFKGKPLSAEHREKISSALKGKEVPLDRRIKISNGLKGKKYNFSEESARNLSECRKNRLVTKDTRDKMSASIKKANIDVTCPWCNKTGKMTGMKSWHFEYCKENPNGISRVVVSKKY